MKLILALFLCLFTFSIIACKDCENISDQDKFFLGIAGSAGIMEVKMGELAVQKATKPELKKFGEMMVHEHNSFNEDYIKVCERICVEPTTVMNDGNRRSVEDMAKLEGDAFNKSYSQFMVEDHGAAVGFFEKADSAALNKTYKKFLERGIKIVKRHYEEAQRLPK